ncbi:MAG: hypothetical protein QM485_12515 [Flavobacteriaceae bacterium]
MKNSKTFSMAHIAIVVLLLCGLSSIGQTPDQYNLDFEHMA